MACVRKIQGPAASSVESITEYMCVVGIGGATAIGGVIVLPLSLDQKLLGMYRSSWPATFGVWSILHPLALYIFALLPLPN